MIQFIIPLLGSVVGSPLFAYILLPIMCLGIISIIPCVVRSLIKGW